MFNRNDAHYVAEAGRDNGMWDGNGATGDARAAARDDARAAAEADAGAAARAAADAAWADARAAAGETPAPMDWDCPHCSGSVFTEEITDGCGHFFCDEKCRDNYDPTRD